ncbi:MAG: uridine kinase [Pseudomonadota bacterium]
MKGLLVGISGGTGSGKTTVATKLQSRLGPGVVTIVDQDSYYRDLKDLSFAERRMFNFDDPDAFDWPLLLDHLDRLAAGHPIEKPVYSFVESVRTDQTDTVAAAPIVFVEGLHVLDQEALRGRLAVKIFVDTDDDVRLARRIVRDTQERGRQIDDILDQYFRSVRPMHIGYVAPQKRYADVIIPNEGRNEVAISIVASGLLAHLQGLREEA